MLRAFVCDGSRMRAAGSGQQDIVWYDLVSPTPQERDEVAKATGLTLPTEEDIVEIENSSRLAADDGVLTLTIPIASRTPEGMQPGAAGFVLSQRHLVTIRFATGLVFDKFVEQPHETGRPDSAHPAYVFAGLLEAIVDRQADSLERMRGELDQLSRNIFRRAQARKGGERERDEEAKLTALLSTLGVTYDMLSILRDSQLGIGRIAAYVPEAADWLPERVSRRLKTVQTDIGSLNEFNAHLAEKVQFLLDATLGLITVSQSKLMKVFTVVAVIGIPPTLIAGIYGMNFHDMPELSWKFGYAYGWGMIVLSAVLPMIWFRLKGWL